MKKTFLPVFLISMTFAVPARAEPIRRLLIPCAGVQKIAISAAAEALARPDRNLFKTKVYMALAADTDKDFITKEYQKFLVVAQTVIDKSDTSTSEQAGEAAMAACGIPANAPLHEIH